MPNKDEIQGKWEQAKGAVKDKLGEATGNRQLEEEGEAEHAEGEAREGVGEARRKVGEAIKDFGDKIGR
ncbi:MAG: CsbD family protein [Pyrinomonas sp.]